MKKRIVWLNEIGKHDIDVAGGKGANLAEMYNAGFPVPPAFIVTANAYKEFLDYNELNEKIKEILKGFDYEDTKEIEERSKKVRELIMKGEIPDYLEGEIIEAYEVISSMDNNPLVSEPSFVAVRSSATAEDLKTASFAGQQETFLNVKGNDALLEAIKKCWASLFTARATYYRHKKGFSHEKTLIAVIVQKMVNSEKSGVMFTINPITNNKNEIVIEAVFGLGEGIVSGSIEPDHYVINKADLEIKIKKIGSKKIEFTRDSSGNNIIKELPIEKRNSGVLENWEIKKIASYGKRLEEHYNWPQDVEWAIEGGNIYILQTRAVTTVENITETRSVEGEILLKGLGASSGIASGKVKIIESMADINKIQKGDILVTKMTNPDMVPVMMKSNAIVTDEGGATSHAAIVSRELGIPAVVGTGKATKLLNDGMIVTVDGRQGIIYKGDLTVKIKEVEEAKQDAELGEKSKSSEKDEAYELIIEDNGAVYKGQESKRLGKVKVKVNSDLPVAAERASRFNPDGIGLVRIEFMIINSGIHPAEYIREGKANDYTMLLVKNLEDIARYFKDKPIWVRTSDLRTDEYRNLKGGQLEPIESDPMIGWHGIRRALDEPEILKAEFRAIKELHDKGYKNIGVMIPFLINVDELRKAKEIMRQVGLEPCKDIAFGVMIETPAACWIIEDLCREGINFISFGTNDLTQLTLGIDRNNERIARLFNEMHPAVLGEIKNVIDVCKRYGVETSICGQAASKPEMAEWLVKHGIDSLSVNIDAIEEIRQLVARVEREKEEMQ